MAYVVVLIALGAAFYLISAPLRAQRRPDESQAEATRVAELEAARDAKYHEIRDAELDLRTGKLSEDDYAAIDGTLRAEAIEIMHALDTAAPAGQASSPSPRE